MKKFSLTKKEDFARGIGATRSKGSPLFNYGKKNYSSDIESAFAAGQTNVAEVLLNNFMNKVYKTVPDILADIDEFYKLLEDEWDTRFAMSDEVIVPRRYMNEITKLRYKQADNIKMKLENFNYDLMIAYTSGQINTLKHLQSVHQSNPYLNNDDIIGDIHILMVNSWGAFRKNHMGRSRPLTLETILAKSETVSCN